HAPAGLSIAITSAPRSASAWMPIGPSRKWLKLTTRIPCSRSSIGVLSLLPLIPAQAGIQRQALGPRFRGDERMLHWVHAAEMGANDSPQPPRRNAGYRSQPRPRFGSP